jgi:hypothetical protein
MLFNVIMFSCIVGTLLFTMVYCIWSEYRRACDLKEEEYNYYHPEEIDKLYEEALEALNKEFPGIR